MTENMLRIYGVPSNLSEGNETIRPAGTAFPLRNGTIGVFPSVWSTRGQASEALLALAREDGWAGLYDPTNESTLTVVSGRVTEIRDALGNLPPMIPSLSNGRLIGSIGALRYTNSGTISVDTGLPEVGFLALQTFGTFGLGSTTTISNPSGSKSLTLGRTDSLGTAVISATSGSESASGSSAYAYTRNTSEIVVHDFSSTGELFIGNHQIPLDDSLAIERVMNVLLGSERELSRLFFGGTSARLGPVFVASGGISPTARENANRLLSILSGGPLSVPDPEGVLSGGYFVRSYASTAPLASHRPDNPQHLASVTKVWTCALAYQLLSAEPGFDVDDPIVMVPKYVPGDTSVNYPALTPGDTMSLRDAIHGSLMVSHNNMTDAIASAAGMLLDPANPIDAFVAHMNSVAKAAPFNWAEAVFTTPQGRGPSYLTSRHVADMFRWVDESVPFIRDVMHEVEWPFTLNRISPPPGEPAALTGTWTNIIRPSRAGGPFPELVGGKSGDTPSPTIRSEGGIFRDLTTGNRLFYSILNSGADTGHRARRARSIWTAVETRYGKPESWDDGGSDSTVTPGIDGSFRYMAGFSRPGNPGPVRVRPIDTASEPLPRVETGDSATFTVIVRVHADSPTLPSDVTARLSLIGGAWTTGEVTVSSSPLSGTTWATLSVSGTVRRGGRLDPYVLLNTDTPGTSVQVRSASLTINHVAQIRRYFELPMRDFQITEDAQSLDSSDLTGGVGDFTAACLIPERDTVIGRYGVGWLQDRAVAILTDRGTYRGIVRAARNTSDVLLEVSGASHLHALVAQRAVGQVFFGSLGDLLTSYLSQVEQFPAVIEIDPGLASKPVRAPYWRGELWHHIKLLASAHRFNLRVDGFTISIEPTPLGETPLFPAIATVEEMGDAQLAQSVEVVRYSGEIISGGLVAPPGGLVDGTEVITVGAGERVVVEIPVNASLSSIVPPVAVDSVGQDYISSSVYSVVDDAGDQVPAEAWLSRGGRVDAVVGPDRRSVFVTVVAPSGVLYREDGEEAVSYALASLKSQGPTQFSTLRIVGNGIGITPEILRVPTGLSSTESATEVGAQIDNPFVFTMAQAAEIGVRAAIRAGGFIPKLSFDVGEGLALGSAPGSIVESRSYDYRVASVSHTPSGSSVTAGYHFTHEGYEGMYPGATYGDVEDGLAEPDPLAYRDDLAMGKRRTP